MFFYHKIQVDQNQDHILQPQQLYHLELHQEVNQLKNNNTIGGEIVWKSGKFNFEIEKKTKSGWFFGKKKSNEENKFVLYVGPTMDRDDSRDNLTKISDLTRFSPKIIPYD